MIIKSYTFKPMGKITNVPTSINFFGAFCYEFSKIYGEIELEKMLDQLYEKPTFAMSSFFVFDFLPKPMDMVFKKKGNIQRNEMDLLKKIKKISFLSKDLFKKYLEDKDEFCNEFLDNIFSGKYKILNNSYLIETSKMEELNFSFYKEDVLIRNYISKEDEEKQLFYNYVKYVDDRLYFKAYIAFYDSSYCEKIDKVVSSMNYSTIGGGKSLGYNLFSFVDSNNEEFINNNEARVLISKAIPDHALNFDKSNYQVEILNNKFNGVGSAKYQKEVVVMNEGSTFITSDMFIGKLIKNSIQNEVKYSNYIGLLL